MVTRTNKLSTKKLPAKSQTKKKVTKKVSGTLDGWAKNTIAGVRRKANS